MSFTPGLFPRLSASAPSLLFRPSLGAARANHSPAKAFFAARSAARQQAIAVSRALPRSSPSSSAASKSRLYTVGLGLTFLTYSVLSPRTVQCQSPFSSSSVGGVKPAAQGRADDLPRPDAPVQSILSVQELGFGAVAGICAGVFLKKGLRAIAFMLGGAFVFLQYLNSRSIVSVDWTKLSSKYDDAFGTRTAAGGVRPPSVTGAFNWIVDFVTANFQQRASFLAGFVLGIRLG